MTKEKTTPCSFVGGGKDGMVIHVTDKATTVEIPWMEGGRIDAHVYIRTGLDSFCLERVVRGSPSDLEEASGRNLDYVFGLQDRVAELECENQALRRRIAEMQGGAKDVP